MQIITSVFQRAHRTCLSSPLLPLTSQSASTKNKGNYEIIRMKVCSPAEAELIKKRTELNDPNTPEIRVKEIKTGIIQMTLRQYPIAFETFMNRLSSQIKISYIHKIAKTYWKLIQTYGLFSLTHENIRFDLQGHMAVWINSDFGQNQSSFILPASKYGQAITVAGFLEIMRSELSSRVFKGAQLASIKQLESYFGRMVKRAGIHKKCQQILKKQNKQKRRITTLPSQFPSSLPRIYSQILNKPKNTCSQMIPGKLQSGFNMRLERDPIKIQLGSQSGTYFSNNIVSKRTNTFFDRIPQKERKSCVVWSPQKENQQKTSLCMPNTTTTVQPNQMIQQTSNKYICSNSSLQASLNNLFLSEASVNQEGMGKKKDVKKSHLEEEFLNDFTSVFY